MPWSFEIYFRTIIIKALSNKFFIRVTISQVPIEIPILTWARLNQNHFPSYNFNLTKSGNPSSQEIIDVLKLKFQCAERKEGKNTYLIIPEERSREVLRSQGFFNHKLYTVVEEKLVAGAYPSSKIESERDSILQTLINKGIDVVINLMESEETDHQGDLFFDYQASFESRGIDVYHFSIEDLSVPSKDLMIEILNTIDYLISRGNKVYVHCWGGIGRAGTVIGCYLLRHHLAMPENVFTKISELKKNSVLAVRPSPETDEQLEMVLGWNY